MERLHLTALRGQMDIKPRFPQIHNESHSKWLDFDLNNKRGKYHWWL